MIDTLVSGVQMIEVTVSCFIRDRDYVERLSRHLGPIMTPNVRLI